MEYRDRREDILHLDDDPASVLCVWSWFMQQLLKMTLFGGKPVSQADFGQRLIHFWPSKELKLIWPRCSIIYFLLASSFDSLGMKLNKEGHEALLKSPCADHYSQQVETRHTTVSTLHADSSPPPPQNRSASTIWPDPCGPLCNKTHTVHTLIQTHLQSHMSTHTDGAHWRHSLESSLWQFPLGPALA